MRTQAGVALAEFALVVPLLMLLLLGVVEVGRYAYFSVLVGNAASAGVQYGAQNDRTEIDDAGMQTAAKNDGQNVPGLTATSTRVFTCWNGTTNTALPNAQATCNPTASPPQHRLVYVQVTTTGDFTSLFNYPFLPSTIAIVRTAQMRGSQTP